MTFTATAVTLTLVFTEGVEAGHGQPGEHTFEIFWFKVNCTTLLLVET